MRGSQSFILIFSLLFLFFIIEFQFSLGIHKIYSINSIDTSNLPIIVRSYSICHEIRLSWILNPFLKFRFLWFYFKVTAFVCLFKIECLFRLNCFGIHEQCYISIDIDNLSNWESKSIRILETITLENRNERKRSEEENKTKKQNDIWQWK